LTSTLAKAEVLTPAEFRKRSRSFWLFETGAGAALFAGALLGMIVGSVIVAQTLYSNTKEHLNEFATLRAIGTSSSPLKNVESSAFSVPLSSSSWADRVVVSAVG